MANNAFAIRGADYAPFRLTVTGGRALSSGVDKSAGGNSVFEQTLNAQPFLLIGNWDRVEVATAKGITAYLPKGASADEQKQAQSTDRAGERRAHVTMRVCLERRPRFQCV
mgnify:CR=1 FL=1